jgi:hypothetical protein
MESFLMKKIFCSSRDGKVIYCHRRMKSVSNVANKCKSFPSTAKGNSMKQDNIATFLPTKS